MPSAVRTVSFLALLARVFASVTFTNPKMDMYAGEPLTLTWEGEAEGDVTIRLMSGSSDDLQVVDTITSTGSDGSFTWTPPKDLDSGIYAFEISDESGDDPNYSASFTYDAEAEAPATTSSTTTAKSTATSSETDTTMTTATGNSTSTSSSTATESESESETETETTTKGSTRTASESDPTGTVTNLNGDESSGIKSDASMMALVGLMSVGLYILA